MAIRYKQGGSFGADLGNDMDEFGGVSGIHFPSAGYLIASD